MTVELQVEGVFNRWQYTLPTTTSRWRLEARKAIGRAIESYENVHAGELDHVELRGEVDAAYPFGERQHLPYKMWLVERRLFLDSLATHEVGPTPDEKSACEVAGDLVEMGRIDEATALLDEQAPNRLCRACPACGVGAGRACREVYDTTYGLALFRDLVVPHISRREIAMVNHKHRAAPIDDGPLFDQHRDSPPGPIERFAEGFLPEDFEDEESSNARARIGAEE